MDHGIWFGNEAYLQKKNDNERATLRKQYDTTVVAASNAKNGAELARTLRVTLAAQTNPWETVSQSHSSVVDDSAKVRSASIAYYGLSGNDECQKIGRLLNPETMAETRPGKIVNSFIWPRHASTNLPLFYIAQSDILIHATCSDFINRLNVRSIVASTFVIDNEKGNGYKLQVLSTDLLANPTPLNGGTSITFKIIQGRPLNLPSGQLPYCCLLAHHCLWTYRNACTMGWDDSIDMNEALKSMLKNVIHHSLDEAAQRRMTLLWGTSPQS